MKQSTKLLSLVLALVMAFSCLSVIGSAASSPLTRDGMKYDKVDDAILTPDQVAGILCDMLDNELLPSAGLDLVDESILGVDIFINLSSVDNVFKSLDSIMGLKGLAGGDLANLTNEGIYVSGSTPRTRANSGDLNCLLNVINWLANPTNAGIISKAVNGIMVDNTDEDLQGGNLLSTILGFIKGFNLGSINNMIKGLPNMVYDMVYDMLIYGSYNKTHGYENDSYPSAEDLTAAGADYATLPTEVNNLDKMLQAAVTGLLVNPQDYEWIDPDNDEKTDNSYKDWDEEGSRIFPTISSWDIGVVEDFFNLYGSSKDYTGDEVADQNNFFELLDKLAPFAIYDLGIPALNNNLKKTLMEAVGVDFYEINYNQVPEEVKKVFDKEDYVTYIGYDCLEKGNDGIWYYTTSKNVPTGEVDIETGEEITERKPVYYRANIGGVNSFYSMVDWNNWNFFAYEPYKGYGDGDGKEAVVNGAYELDYTTMVKKYGSIFGSLNHILSIVYENCLTTETKNAFKAMTDVGWVDGDNTNLDENLTRLIKYLLAEHADSIFGRDSAYVDWDYEDVANKDLIDLIAIIGPSFFEDAMPQLIIPQDEDGTYAFGENNQLLKFGALVLREFVSEISPSTNYDAYIFANGTLTSATGRQFINKDAKSDADYWFNLILNMGLDVAYTYLDQLTNFSEKTPAVDVTEARWMGMLDKVVTWGVNYVGSGDTSVLNGLAPNTVAGKGDAFGKLSYVLNTILPLGFINGCTSDTYDFDVSLFFGKIKEFFNTVSFETLFSIFGRNTDPRAYNMLLSVNVPTAILDLVNDILGLVIGKDLLPYENNISGNLTNAYVTINGQTNALKQVVNNLLTGLYSRASAILNCGLPVLAKFVSDWGGEQELGSPQFNIENTVVLKNGAATDVTFIIRNGSAGLWRGYKASNSATEYSKDYHYNYNILGVAAYNYDGSPSSYVNTLRLDKSAVNFGSSATLTYNVSNVPNPGAIVRWEIVYNITDEDQNVMADGKVFKMSIFSWLSYNESDERVRTDASSSSYRSSIFSPIYVPLSDPFGYLQNVNVGEIWRENVALGSTQYFDIYPTAGTSRTVDGITIGYLDGGTVSSSDVQSGFLGIGAGPLKDVTNIRTGSKFATGNAKPIGLSNDNYNSTGIPLFKNGDVNFTKEDGSVGATYSVKGASFDENAWKKATKESGSTSTWTMSLFTKNDTQTNKSLVIRYYDDIYRDKLIDLVNSENKRQRAALEIYYSDDVYYPADELLTNRNEAETSDDIETNFTNTMVVNGETVTAINAMQACNTYVAALQAAIRGAYQEWSSNTSVYNFEELYTNLRVAANDVEYVRNLSAGDDIDSKVIDLKAHLAAVEAQYSEGKDYTDYKMYRWNRYNDAKEVAEDIVNAYEATLLTESDLTKYFDYTDIGTSELEKLVDDDKYEAYILALLEDYDEETIAKNREDLEDAKEHYAGYELLDVAQAENLLNRIPQRLLARDHGVLTNYLDVEIASAKNQIGTDNGTKENPTKYTWRSWANYIAAYETAVKVQANPTQMTVFDAKYELEVARNELVLLGNEADYSELEALIAQATQAIANGSLYDNTAKELGKVLAELGYTVDDTDLFPGSALDVNNEPYSTEDQKYVDRAATALKEALANLKFKGLAFTGAQVETETLVPGDAEEGIDAITASVARIAALQDADAVKALFKATADDAGAVELTVSNDEVYTVDTDLKGYTGSNATVTFYTAVDGIKVPVATVKIVVEADVNGDGVLDVLDGALTELVSNGHAELEGCYFLAANLDTATAEEIVAADYTAVVNKIVAA